MLKYEKNIEWNESVKKKDYNDIMIKALGKKHMHLRLAASLVIYCKLLDVHNVPLVYHKASHNVPIVTLVVDS